MDLQLLEVRVYRGGAEVPHSSPLRLVLDMRDLPGLRDLLNRHLLAAAERAGATREQAYLYVLHLHDLDRFGKPEPQPRLRWALPITPQQVPTWL